METDHLRGTWSLLQREQELAQLERFVDNVEHEVPTRQIVVTGLARTGRTALLREMSRRASNQGRAVGSAAVEGPDGLPRAIIEGFEGAIGSMIARRPGAPALHRMKQALDTFAASTMSVPVSAPVFAHAIDQLLPSLTFDRAELQSGYLVTLDDLQRAHPDHVGALLEGLVAMAMTGAPLGVIVSATEPLAAAALVSDVDNLELVSLGTFDHAAVRSIAGQCGVSMLDGGLRRLEEVTLGLAGDLFPLLSELALRRGELGAADVDEVMALLRNDDRQASVRSIITWSPPWSGGREPSEAEPVPVSAAMIRDALAGALASATSEASSLSPFVPRLVIASGAVTDLPAPARPTVSEPRSSPVLFPVAPEPRQLPEPVLFPVAPEPRSLPEVFPTRVAVTPAQRRILRTVDDLRGEGVAVSIDSVRRRVGDLNRFTGVSPVVEAIEAMLAVGLLELRGARELDLTPVGESALLTSA